MESVLYKRTEKGLKGIKLFGIPGFGYTISLSKDILETYQQDFNQRIEKWYRKSFLQLFKDISFHNLENIQKLQVIALYVSLKTFVKTPLQTTIKHSYQKKMELDFSEKRIENVNCIEQCSIMEELASLYGIHCIISSAIWHAFLCYNEEIIDIGRPLISIKNKFLFTLEEHQKFLYKVMPQLRITDLIYTITQKIFQVFKDI